MFLMHLIAVIRLILLCNAQLTRLIAPFLFFGLKVNANLPMETLLLGFCVEVHCIYGLKSYNVHLKHLKQKLQFVLKGSEIRIKLKQSINSDRL